MLFQVALVEVVPEEVVVNVRQVPIPSCEREP